MNVEHVELSKSKLKRRSWIFAVYVNHISTNVQIVLERYVLAQRATTRHGFKMIECWSRLYVGSFNESCKVGRPEIPKKIMDLIRAKVVDSIVFSEELK